MFISFIESLAAGFVDDLKANGIRVIGPSRAAAELESSKARAKRFCLDHGLATAPYRDFDDPEAAKRYIDELDHPVVVKETDLRPVGDGAHVCGGAEDARLAIDTVARQASGAGRPFSVVVEKRLFGREVSVFAFLDGEHYLLFPFALDYKRVADGDSGKNCDGMGSVSPHPLDGPALRSRVRREILDPLMVGLRAEGLEYTGFVYVGAMLTAEGLRVLEINTRFGDSEAQVVLPGVHSNFHEMCRKALARDLPTARLVTDALIRCCVVAAQGCVNASEKEAYPGWPFGAFRERQPVRGAFDIASDEAEVFLAGVAPGDPELVTAGGRVLHVVGRGMTPEDAIGAAYRNLARVSFPGMYFRNDIGRDILGTSPERRRWWGTVSWTRILSRAPAPDGTLSSTLARIAADPRKTSASDSLLVAYFADEREVADWGEFICVAGGLEIGSSGTSLVDMARVAKSVALREDPAAPGETYKLVHAALSQETEPSMRGTG